VAQFQLKSQGSLGAALPGIGALLNIFAPLKVIPGILGAVVAVVLVIIQVAKFAAMLAALPLLALGGAGAALIALIQGLVAAITAKLSEFANGIALRIDAYSYLGTVGDFGNQCTAQFAGGFGNTPPTATVKGVFFFTASEGAFHGLANFFTSGPDMPDLFPPPPPENEISNVEIATAGPFLSCTWITSLTANVAYTLELRTKYDTSEDVTDPDTLEVTTVVTHHDDLVATFAFSQDGLTHHYTLTDTLDEGTYYFKLMTTTHEFETKDLGYIPPAESPVPELPTDDPSGDADDGTDADPIPLPADTGIVHDGDLAIGDAIPVFKYLADAMDGVKAQLDAAAETVISIVGAYADRAAGIQRLLDSYTEQENGLKKAVKDFEAMIDRLGGIGLKLGGALAIGTVFVYRYEGTVAEMGPAVQAALQAGLPKRHNPGQVIYAKFYLASSDASWVFLAPIVGG
jgi:hypothetical protein